MRRNPYYFYRNFRYRWFRSKHESEEFDIILFIKIWLFDQLLHIEPLKASLPWMPYNAIFSLNSIINKTFNILEIGSGGSTLFYLNRCNTLITLEHDKEWIKKLKGIKIKRMYREKWSLIQKDLHTNIKSNDFSPYLSFIDSQKDENFDLISIDGRLRSECLILAYTKVKPNGYIILDNSDRCEYSDGINFLNNLGWLKTELSGLCYFYNWDSKATIWQRI